MSGKRARWSGSDPAAGLISYEAIDGSQVALPVRTVPGGEPPVWTASDFPWVSETFAFFWKQAFERPYSPAELAAVEKRFASAKAQFLDSAEGFAMALNAAKTTGAFWAAIEAPFGFWGPRIERMERHRQVVFRDILMAYPPLRRLELMAARLWPRTKIRKWEAIYEPVVDYFQQPYADLRAFETGVPKLTEVEAMTPELLDRVAAEFDKLDRSLGGFLRHVHSVDPGKGPWRPSGGAKTRITASEENLLRTQSFLKAMRKVKPGIPGGHLMELALSEKPAGGHWPNIRWEEFPTAAVWPYIASHIDILEIALGVREPFHWQPRLSRIKALKTLALLPKLPMRITPALDAVLSGGTAAQQKLAATLLKSGTG